MGLSQSLYTGWSGLATHQRALDNTSNNLANVNTAGYRKTDYVFSNLMNQFMSGGMGAVDDRGSVGPINVGKGVMTGATLTNFTQGNIEGTGNPLDVAIDGNGFFMVNTHSGLAMTRHGSFYLDHTVNPLERLLCVGDGLPVQGWMAQDNTITPSQTVGNIYLPARGDLLPGKVTSDVDLTGILPTNTSGADFSGTSTRNLDLKGALSAANNAITTHIFAPVTQTGGTEPIKDQIQEIKVEIAFDGPTLAADGSANSWNWTMKTVDWPNPGDPQVQIYPPENDPEFTQGSVTFYAEADPGQNRAVGQAVKSSITPGSTSVSTLTAGTNGNAVTTSFTIPSSFTLDVSRLNDIAGEAPGSGAALETWYVDGSPAGALSRTINVFDEYTDFVKTTDANGNEVMEAVRSVKARQNTIYFQKTGSDDAGTDWSWRSSVDDATGTLRFNTMGDLASSTSSGGGIAYDFSDIRNINSSGSLQVASQDGYQDGHLEDVTIDQAGKIFGHYSNDVVELLAQLAIGNVPNPSGLEGSNGTLFYTGAASGAVVVGAAGDSYKNSGMPSIGAGLLVTSSLEGSNVVLGKEFTDLINIERGYQFNSRVVTTSDEMLQTALQLKR